MQLRHSRGFTNLAALELLMVIFVGGITLGILQQLYAHLIEPVIDPNQEHTSMALGVLFVVSVTIAILILRRLLRPNNPAA